MLHLKYSFTVLQGHCPSRSLLLVKTAGPPMPLGDSRHCWLRDNDLFMTRSCQSPSAMPPRVQDTRKQEDKTLTNAGPHVLSQTFNTPSDWPSQEILFEKQSLDLAGVGVKRNHSSPGIRVYSVLSLL